MLVQRVPAPQSGKQKEMSSTNLKINPKDTCFSLESVKYSADFDLPYFTEPDNRVWCRNQCKRENFKYAGVHTPKLDMIRTKGWEPTADGRLKPTGIRPCKCFNSFDDQKKSNNCNRWCQDFDQTKFCGGHEAMNVWRVDSLN